MACGDTVAHNPCRKCGTYLSLYLSGPFYRTIQRGKDRGKVVAYRERRCHYCHKRA